MSTFDSEETTHKRRVRYKGTHPTKYQEKYKELQPEKYSLTVEKVIQKGSTPAGMHLPICLSEILDFLQIKPGQIGLDCTLGYGGHTQEMLKKLEGRGHLYATDVDSFELPRTTSRLNGLGFGPEILTTKNTNYSNIDELVKESGTFDFILADLGVSSMQIDNPERGFSYKTEGPLDLRLNPSQGISAKERLKGISQEELEGMLLENADEPYAHQISVAIVHYLRKGNLIDTTTQLQEVIQRTLASIPDANNEVAIKKSCQRCFQAIRIDVNNELEGLYSFLEKLPFALSSNGRVAILTFHSGEDRLVKKAFKRLYAAGIFSEISPEAIRPSKEECLINGRARSAKLRLAVKA